MREVDVLVVGLGPGGANAAWQAAAAGLRVLAVEKKKRIGDPVQCAEFIPNPIGRYAQAPGVLHQRIVGMKSMLPSGAIEASDFPGLMIDRGEFDRALAAEAAAAGADIAIDTRLRALDTAAGTATVETAGQTPETLRYRLLIAADGPHSTVARLLGLPDLKVVQTRQYTVPLLRDYVDTDIWLSDEFPGGYAWLFPKGRYANLGLGADRRFEDNLKAPLERLHSQLAADGLLGADIVARTGGAIPVGGLRERLAVGRVLFVGDAGGLTHPITGGGIAAAVESGELAGKAAAGYLAGGDTAVLDGYDEDVRDQFGPTLERAVERRRYLEQHWRKPAANEDRVQRRGWIAFNEYFS